MALIFLDDVLGIIVGVERVHQDEWYVNIIGAVEILDLSDGQIQEGHAIANFDDRLRTHATHRCTEATVELENSELAEESDRLGVGELIVVNNLVLCWWGNAVPIPMNRQY